MKRHKLFSVVLSACMLLAAGCAARVKNVTNLPAGVTQKQAQDWDAAVADLHKIAATVSALRQGVIDVRNAGAFPSNEYYADTLRAIGHMDQLELSAQAVLQQSPQNFSQSAKQQVAAYVTQISTELEKLNTVDATGIKNPASVKKVNGLISSVVAAVNLVIALSQ